MGCDRPDAERDPAPPGTGTPGAAGPLALLRPRLHVFCVWDGPLEAQGCVSTEIKVTRPPVRGSENASGPQHRGEAATPISPEHNLPDRHPRGGQPTRRSPAGNKNELVSEKAKMSVSKRSNRPLRNKQ